MNSVCVTVFPTFFQVTEHGKLYGTWGYIGESACSTPTTGWGYSDHPRLEPTKREAEGPLSWHSNPFQANRSVQTCLLGSPVVCTCDYVFQSEPTCLCTEGLGWWVWMSSKLDKQVVADGRRWEGSLAWSSLVHSWIKTSINRNWTTVAASFDSVPPASPAPTKWSH